MTLTDRALLRLHVEAVWGVRLPAIEQNEITLLPESARPDWQLYAADLAEGRIYIWPEEKEPEERAELYARLNEALASPLTVEPPAGISREVALSLAAAPTIDLAAARRIARPLALDDDLALLRTFLSEEPVNLLRPESGPLIGSIVDRRMLTLAHSSRRTAEACELGIETLPEARRKGYALAATVVWSNAIAREGLTPLYSARASNTASLNLAMAAGYREFARAAMLEAEP